MWKTFHLDDRQKILVAQDMSVSSWTSASNVISDTLSSERKLEFKPKTLNLTVKSP